MFPGHEESSRLVIICCILSSQWFSANSFTPVYKPQCLFSITDFCGCEGYYSWGEANRHSEQALQPLEPLRWCCNSGESSPWCLQCWEPLQRHWVGNRIVSCPSEKKIFLWEAVSKNAHDNNAVHDITFHSKNCLLICYHSPPLLHYVLSIFYILPISAACILAPIDHKVI